MKVICTPGSTCATHSLASSSGRANSHAGVELELDVPVPPPRMPRLPPAASA